MRKAKRKWAFRSRRKFSTSLDDKPNRTDARSPARLNSLFAPGSKKRKSPLVREVIFVFGQQICILVCRAILAHTGNPKNCQRKRAVLKVFWSARYCGGGTAGKYNPAGLPEAAGGIYTADGYELLVANNVATTDGFRIKTGSAGQASPGTGQNMAVTEIEFWASGCNSIYGASHTVMPPSADIPVALYLGSPAKV